MPSANETIGARIKTAREDAGITQIDLAQTVGIDRSSLAKLEGGSRKVSALELAAIAEALGSRIEWFLQDAPPAVVARRNVREPGDASPTIDRLGDRIAREVEFVASLDEKLRDVLVDPERLPRPRNRRDVEDAACSARQSLGVSDGPLWDLSRKVAVVGLLAFSVGLGTDSADGASLHLSSGGVAIVNGDLRVGRRRLTLAHELGHHLFADQHSVDWQIGANNRSDRRESQIDHFARAVLLPEGELGDAWAEERTRGRTMRQAAVLLASRYRVDMSTLGVRLAELRLISAGDVQEVRKVQTTKADIVELDLLVADELAPPLLPRDYEEAVLRIYRRELVSAARASGLLLGTWEEGDLPDLAPLPEDAIWSFVT